MEKKTIRFLRLSVIAIVVVCVCVFSFFVLFMNYESSKAMNDIGSVYMSQMSERISLHFDTSIESHIEGIKFLMDRAERFSDYESVADILRDGAEARGDLNGLAFCSNSGELEILYGDGITIEDPEPFFDSLKNGTQKVAFAKAPDGSGLVLVGVPAVYNMKSGEKSLALLGTFPVSLLREHLVLDDDYDTVYSHIIRRDGSFVISSAGETDSNYLELTRKYFTGLNGKTGEEYYTEMSAAMEARVPYSSIFYRMVNDQKELRHLYCTPLEHSEWFLVTIMPYGYINTTVQNFSNQYVFAAITCCIIVLISFAVIFIRYIKIANHQIAELDKARMEAINATKAKSEFLSNMSHDIRTPMNAIVGMTAIATSHIDDKQQVKNCLRKITLSSRHLLGLINDVLDMSKIESGKMTLSAELISLRDVMDNIVSIVQPQVKSRNQKFDIFIHNIFAENIYGDSVRINQVLINLLSNAMKFTPEGGKIEVDMREDESPKGSGYVRIHVRVKDTGIGISPEFKDKIFDSFTREDGHRVAKIEGTGLGMAITKHIIDAMDGTIEVNSKKGEGTEFHITFDAERADVQEEDMRLPEWRMLVVDDDEQLCKSVISSLEEIGINAEWALNGEAAVKKVAERCENHTEYHVILLDWDLPGIDGIEAAREIRQKVGSEVPILLISAYDWSDIEGEARDAGIDGFISKPLFKSTLYHGLKPYADEENAQDKPSEKKSFDFTGKRVLVAEDIDINWEVAEILLRTMGVEPDHAENGKICVEMFEKSEVGYYDAILMDLRMPIMSGYEATELIRKMVRPDADDIPIIAMTADAFSEDIQKCLSCGMNSHIAKPIEPQAIARVLEKYITERNSKESDHE